MSQVRVKVEGTEDIPQLYEDFIQDLIGCVVIGSFFEGGGRYRSAYEAARVFLQDVDGLDLSEYELELMVNPGAAPSAEAQMVLGMLFAAMVGDLRKDLSRLAELLSDRFDTRTKAELRALERPLSHNDLPSRVCAALQVTQRCGVVIGEVVASYRLVEKAVRLRKENAELIGALNELGCGPVDRLNIPMTARLDESQSARVKEACDLVEAFVIQLNTGWQAIEQRYHALRDPLTSSEAVIEIMRPLGLDTWRVLINGLSADSSVRDMAIKIHAINRFEQAIADWEASKSPQAAAA